MSQFCHLHCHTQYSLLDGATDIEKLMAKAKADGMPAVALTDHGNMFGCFDFVAEGKKAGVKPILGCEFYLVSDRHKHSFLKSMGEKDKRYHQLLLAKSQKGYENLCKLCSLGFIEGLYGKFPRIDKELLVQYHEGLIASSCCLGAEIPQAILHGKYEEAETLLKWWLNIFGDDYYIEIQRHKGYENIDNTGVSQESINQHLLTLAKKYNVKVIATNDVHYLQEEDNVWHDVLLAINTNADLDSEDRFKFNSTDFFFKTTEEMGHRFQDVPFALENTLEIADKCFEPNLFRDVILPEFPIPPGFDNQQSYLHHLVYEGAKKRYGNISEVVRERIDFELSVLDKMNFQGYFLIVQDFIKAARDLGVAVGPGRGSAAGSVVAYCLTITDIDPIRYNLLFERFLNPERVSMPDIDIDFDDLGRQKVLDYVVKKYGQDKVAQIVTYGTMAAKSSIRDVARVKKMELPRADRLAKLVPTRPGIKLYEILDESKSLPDELNADEKAAIKELRSIQHQNTLEGEVLQMAVKLEGSIRNTGVHAAGVIIAPDEITKYIPLCVQKDSDLYVTQVEGNVIEQTGLLKMDFLGLTTLSIMRDAIKNIVKRHGEEKRVVVDDIPLDDIPTLELFQQGKTTGLFQFESPGMRKYMKELRPTHIEDIIAMNALYRPGPMDNIPEFINRKHGIVQITYPHEKLKGILENTYGIMVYQEQIMQSAQIMADYSLGEADILRRAMGKKKKEEMDKQKKLFVERALKNQVDESKANEIFDTMAKFASYGFNRSHAAAYSVLAFQTAYLKAHYPAEFMASVLTHNKSNITSLTFFLTECKEMKIDVLGPDINESEMDFTVNAKGQIRFGLSALKGMGEGPVEAILTERESNGKFVDLFDFMRRMNLRTVNKKCMEALVLSGALDNFTIAHRAQYFLPSEKYDTYIDHLLRWGSQVQASHDNLQASLFGDVDNIIAEGPNPPPAQIWSLPIKLSKEKEVAGIFFSGHPLDDYRQEIKHLANATIIDIDNMRERPLRIAAFVTGANHRLNQKGEGFGIFSIQDYASSMEVRLFKEQYLKFKQLMAEGNCVLIEGTYQKSFKVDVEEYVFRVNQVRLLSAAFEEFVKRLKIKIMLGDLSSQTIQALDKLISKNKGNKSLSFSVLDPTEELDLHLINAKKKIHITPELLNILESMGLHYAINS